MQKVGLGQSFLCAIRGIFRGISNERSLKIQLVLGISAILISLILEISKIYLITIILVCFLVIILELFNRNFERLINLVSPEYNKEAGAIKDTMAGIVLATSVLAVIVGGLILYEPVINLFNLLSQSLISLLMIIANVILSSIILIMFYIKRRIKRKVQ